MRIELDKSAAAEIASRIAWSYVIAAIGAAMCGAAALIYAIRWR